MTITELKHQHQILGLLKKRKEEFYARQNYSSEFQMHLSPDDLSSAIGVYDKEQIIKLITNLESRGLVGRLQPHKWDYVITDENGKSAYLEQTLLDEVKQLKKDRGDVIRKNATIAIAILGFLLSLANAYVNLRLTHIIG